MGFPKSVNQFPLNSLVNNSLLGYSWASHRLGVVVKIWGFCFAYLLCFNASMAQGESRRALEMAECGYLVGLAAEQLHARDTASEDLDMVVGEVIDFTNLYYHLAGLERPSEGPALSLPMYRTIMDVGQRTFSKRISGLSVETSNKLANTLMAQCRQDLQLLGLKLGHG